MSSGRIPSVEGGIQPTIVDAKGDLIVATAADTVSRLAVGSNDQVLTADSSTSTGLKWAAAAAGGMTLLSTTTLSGATTTISSIPGGYNALIGYVYGVTNATADGNFRFLPNNDTTLFSGYRIEDAATVNQCVDTRVFLTSTSTNIPSRTSANNFYYFRIDNYASTTTYKACEVRSICEDGNPLDRGFMMQGGLSTNSAITSLVFQNSGGNLSTGTVLLYGVK